MHQFEMYNPLDSLPEQRLLRVYNDPMGGGDKYYFIHQSEHLLIYLEDFHTYPKTAGDLAGTTELFRYQYEMPLPGIHWFIDVIEQKFFKSPSEGGLPANKLSYEETVSGEVLHVMRTLGGGERPGYVITNGSRHAHYGGPDLQELNLSDRWLFDGGLMDYLKELADQYEQGTL